MMTPYKPLELSGYDVEVFEELIFSKRLFSLSKKEPSEKLRFILPSSASNESFDFLFSLTADHHQIDLSIKPTSESNFIQSLSQFGGKESIPKDLLTAATAFCGRNIISLLEVLLQIPISLESLQDNDKQKVDDRKKLYFEIINKNSVVELQGEIKLPSLLIKKLLLIAVQSPSAVRLDLDEFLFQGEVMIGKAQLLLSQLSALMPGDLVFFEEPSACVTGKGFFYFQHGQRLPLALDATQFQSLIQSFKDVAVSGFVPPEVSDLEKKRDDQEQELASLQKLVNIELFFSIGTLSLMLNQLEQLAKTNESPPIQNVSSLMKIYAQGTLIGAGELVEIHGQHAAFITQLNLVT